MLNFQRNTSCIVLLTSYLILASCSIQKQIAKSANEDVLTNKALTAAHVGISIFEPAANKYWFNYQGDKYFVPASNTKLPTCYAAMKYLGDSLVGLRYDVSEQAMTIFPSGDPTFLLPEFGNQPVLTFLKKNNSDININFSCWQEESLGSGWSWNDYQEPYMAERSPMPAYGNIIEFSKTPLALVVFPFAAVDNIEMDHPLKEDTYLKKVVRSWNGNFFKVTYGVKEIPRIYSTMYTDSGRIIMRLLSDILPKKISITYSNPSISNKQPLFPSIKTQPTDSLLKPMMHRSDNFFAEQSLLMVSNERLGYMNDEKIIDTLLKTDFKDLPQKPRWADGSGLSRYNLFTPQDFVAILNKMKNEFGMERIKVILPTGGEGTISSYYKADSGYIYGKTGTLSGVVAFSGFLYTKKGKLLIFSTLVNNHQASATEVRKAVEKFIQGIRNKY